jgi:hypothetical protein
VVGTRLAEELCFRRGLGGSVEEKKIEKAAELGARRKRDRRTSTKERSLTGTS